MPGWPSASSRASDTGRRREPTFTSWPGPVALPNRQLGRVPPAPMTCRDLAVWLMTPVCGRIKASTCQSCPSLYPHVADHAHCRGTPLRLARPETVCVDPRRLEPRGRRYGGESHQAPARLSLTRTPCRSCCTTRCSSWFAPGWRRGMRAVPKRTLVHPLLHRAKRGSTVSRRWSRMSGRCAMQACIRSNTALFSRRETERN